jgi:hypothetical protein
LNKLSTKSNTEFTQYKNKNLIIRNRNKNESSNQYTRGNMIKYKENLNRNFVLKNLKNIQEIIFSKMSMVDDLRIVCRSIKKCGNKKHKNKIVNLYEKFLPYVDSLFDYVNVAITVKEFEYFKQIYFSENQRNLFSLVKIKLNERDSAGDRGSERRN